MSEIEAEYGKNKVSSHQYESTIERWRMRAVKAVDEYERKKRDHPRKPPRLKDIEIRQLAGNVVFLICEVRRLRAERDEARQALQQRTAVYPDPTHPGWG